MHSHDPNGSTPLQRGEAGLHGPLFGLLVINVVYTGWTALRNPTVLTVPAALFALGLIVVYVWRLPRRTDDCVSFRSILLLFGTVGVVAGFGEVVLVTLRIEALGDNGWRLSSERVWMVPLGSGLFYLAVGVVLGLVGTVAGRFASSFLVMFFAALLFVNHWIEVSFTRLHWAAGLVLATGLALRIAPSLAPRAPGLIRWCRRAAPGVVAALLLAWMGHAAASYVREWQRIRRLPPAVAGAPNVLLLVLDTVRAPSLGLYGNARPSSPTIDSIAAHGTTFETALATAPWTLPSHASLFTGREATELGVTWDVGLDGTYPTLAEILGRHGYVSGAFIANFTFLSPPYGLHRGFTRHRGYPVSVRQMNRNAWRIRTLLQEVRPDLVTVRKRASQVNQEFLDWLDRRGDRPFFGFLNYMDAHTPYDPPAPFDRIFSPDAPLPKEFGRGAHTPAKLDSLLRAYESGIAYIDHQIGQLVEALRDRGVLDNTLLVIASDHGESFGEQAPDLVEHANSLFMPTLHVPLVFVLPNVVPAGTRAADPVSIRAVPATIVELLGLDASAFGDIPRLRAVTGGSADGSPPIPLLAELVEQADPGPGDQGGYGDMYSLLADTLHYIRRGDDREALFDVSRDPWEVRDLAGSNDAAPILASFRMWLRRLVDGPFSGSGAGS